MTAAVEVREARSRSSGPVWDVPERIQSQSPAGTMTLEDQQPAAFEPVVDNGFGAVVITHGTSFMLADVRQPTS